jgi:hypothetical protein
MGLNVPGPIWRVTCAILTPIFWIFSRSSGGEVATCSGRGGRAEIFSIDGLIELGIGEMFGDIGREWDFSVLLKHFEPFMVWHGDFYQSASIGLPYDLERHTIFENNRSSGLEASLQGNT